MTLDQQSKRLSDWLTAYATHSELLVMRVLSGSDKVSSCRAMPSFRNLYREVVPQSGAKPVLLAACHVRLIVALCRVRETRRQPSFHGQAVRALERARHDHRLVLQELL